jgi:hypothetical protein
MVQRHSPGVGTNHGQKHTVDKAASCWSRYHPSVSEPSRYQDWRRVTLKVVLSAREQAEHKHCVGTVDEKLEGKEVHAPQPDLIRRQSLP